MNFYTWLCLTHTFLYTFLLTFILWSLYLAVYVLVHITVFAVQNSVQILKDVFQFMYHFRKWDLGRSTFKCELNQMFHPSEWGGAEDTSHMPLMFLIQINWHAIVIFGISLVGLVGIPLVKWKKKVDKHLFSTVPERRTNFNGLKLQDDQFHTNLRRNLLMAMEPVNYRRGKLCAARGLQREAGQPSLWCWVYFIKQDAGVNGLQGFHQTLWLCALIQAICHGNGACCVHV